MVIVIYSPVRIFCEALATCLCSQDGIDATKSCYRQKDIGDVVQKFSPDVILFDVSNPDALIDAENLKSSTPKTPILALALPDISADVIACAEVGIVGYLPKQASVEQLVPMIQAAICGEAICSPKITRALIREVRNRKKLSSQLEAPKTLTPRECEVMQLVAQGLSNKTIASEMHVSAATVKNHLHNIFTKLDVCGRVEAIAMLRGNG